MLKSFLEASDAVNKPCSVQLREMKHAFISQCILPTEYYGLRLGLRNELDVQEYVGIFGSKILWADNELADGLATRLSNKAGLASYLTQFFSSVLYTPPYKTQLFFRDHADNRSMVKQLCELVLSSGKYTDVFIKPVTDSYGGQGIIRVMANDDKVFLSSNGTGILELTNEMNTDEVVPLVHNSIYLIQETLHAAFVGNAPIGTSPASIRMLVEYVDNKAKVVAAIQKARSVINTTDNFATHVEAPGNIIGWINTSGLVDRWLTNERTFSHEPIGCISYPNYAEHVAAVEQVATSVLGGSGYCLTGWDVVITEKGVTVLEVNLRSGFEMFQAASKRGLFEIIPVGDDNV